MTTEGSATQRSELWESAIFFAILTVGLLACGGSSASPALTQATPGTAAAASPAASPTTAAATGSACNLVTSDDVAAAVGYSIAKSSDVDSAGLGTDQCTFQGTDPSNVFYLTIYKTQQAQQTPLHLEANSEQVPGLGDSAFWAPTAGLFVHKGGQVLGLQAPGVTASRDALVALAAKALGKL